MSELKNFSVLTTIKKSALLNVYLVEIGEEKFVVKEILTSEARQRMLRAQKLLDNITKSFPNFPCVRAEKLIDSPEKVVYIERFINGNCLSEKTFCAKDIKIVCENLVNYLRLLRDIDVDRAHVDWKDFLAKYVATKTLPPSLFKVYEPTALNRFLTYIQNFLDKIIFKKETHLVHNDLNAENILVQQDLKICVLDYEWWIIGDPLKDLSKMIWYFRRFPQFGNIFLEIYRDAFGDFDENILKFYFAVDILNHLSQYEILICSSTWKAYFKQELEIVCDIWREGFCLWH